MGDCTVLGSLASLAQSNPSQIRNNIQATANPNEYKVTLYSRQNNGNKSVVTPTVETVNLDHLQALSCLDPTSGKHVLWPALYEKAYAQLQQKGATDTQGIAALNKGGIAATALQALTGRPVSMLKADEPSTPATIRSALVEGRAVTAGILETGTEATETVDHHLYSVLGASADGKSITIRNPWGFWGGQNHLPSDKSVVLGADGTATMPMATFGKVFGSVTISAAPAEQMRPAGQQTDAGAHAQTSTWASWGTAGQGTRAQADGAAFNRGRIVPLLAAGDQNGAQAAAGQAVGQLFAILNANAGKPTSADTVAQAKWVAQEAQSIQSTLVNAKLPLNDGIPGLLNQAQGAIGAQANYTGWEVAQPAARTQLNGAVWAQQNMMAALQGGQFDKALQSAHAAGASLYSVLNNTRGQPGQQAAAQLVYDTASHMIQALQTSHVPDKTAGLKDTFDWLSGAQAQAAKIIQG